MKINQCKVCGDIEPQDHTESWWLCSCKSKNSNLDEALKRVESKKQEEKC